MSRVLLCVFAGLLVLLHAAPSSALPTMIRIGYPTCASCHLSAQGGGLLTEYGKGIDTAQSRRKGEYQPSEKQRRLFYDVRFVMAATAFTSEGASPVKASNFRFLMRSAFQTSAHTRLSYQAGLETPPLTRHASATTPRSAQLVVSKALFEYTPSEHLQIAVGRDTLPTALGLPDPQTFQRRQNDPLGTGYPTQLKAFIAPGRFQFTPYVYGPGFDETRSARQHGGGLLAGLDVWKQRAIVGVSFRKSASDAFDRQSVGAYARLGFGRWGILTEHDLTTRVDARAAAPAADYIVGFTQLFVAPLEWFVTSLQIDNVAITGPDPRRLYRLAPTVALRLSENLTIVLASRDDFVGPFVPTSRTYSVSFAVKTVQ